MDLRFIEIFDDDDSELLIISVIVDKILLKLRVSELRVVLKGKGWDVWDWILNIFRLSMWVFGDFFVSERDDFGLENGESSGLVFVVVMFCWVFEVLIFLFNCRDGYYCVLVM